MFVHFAVFDVSHAQVNVRRIIFFDGQINHYGSAIGVYVARFHHVSQFGRHQQMSFVGRQQSQNLCRLSGLVSFLVGNQFDRTFVAPGSADPTVVGTGDIKTPGFVFYLPAVFGDDGIDVYVTDVGRAVFKDGFALSAGCHFAGRRAAKHSAVFSVFVTVLFLNHLFVASIGEFKLDAG